MYGLHICRLGLVIRELQVFEPNTWLMILKGYSQGPKMEAYYLAFAGVVRASDLALFLGEQGAAVADFGKQLRTAHFGYWSKVPRRRVLVYCFKTAILVLQGVRCLAPFARSSFCSVALKSGGKTWLF